MILGHESAGIIVEVGSNVKSVKVGDRVAMEVSCFETVVSLELELVLTFFFLTARRKL